MLPTITEDPTSRSWTKEAYTLGSLHEYAGKLWKFVKNGSADTNAIKGQLACRMTATDDGVCTMKASEVTSGTLPATPVTMPYGVWAYGIAFGSYGFVQVSGECDYLVTDGGVVDGDYLVCDGGGTETFVADTAAAGEEHGVFAVATETDTSTTVTARLLNMI